MNIFVTGATGVLGNAVVPLLVAASHHVRALSRSENNVETLRRLGAEPVPTNLFDFSHKRQLQELLGAGLQAAGYPSGCGNSALIQELIQQTFGQKYTRK